MNPMSIPFMVGRLIMATTREASKTQEKRVANKLGGVPTPNSGGGKFKKGDVIVEEAGLLIECKTCMKPKNSFSIKKEWVEKSKHELFASGLSNSVIAFNFDYLDDKNDYFVIDDKLMKYLVEKLKEENDN